MLRLGLQLRSPFGSLKEQSLETYKWIKSFVSYSLQYVYGNITFSETWRKLYGKLLSLYACFKFVVLLSLRTSQLLLSLNNYFLTVSSQTKNYKLETFLIIFPSFSMSCLSINDKVFTDCACYRNVKIS